ncbi:putative SET domain containing protein [Leishmania naiffi]|uniref:SET domain containing protein n=1 Tax=Leishmania naiffi TaxID=5678 RepID=A0AAW3BH43_9TRYP
MSLLNRLHGARWCPLRQQRRRCNGVRGVFAAATLDRGDLVLSVPLRYCYITQFCSPHNLGRSSDSSVEMVKSMPHLRRCNRGVALFPEAWMWLQRFSADADTDHVSLSCTISCEAAPESMSAVPTVMSLTLSPVEAALATCVTLRYFYAHALHLSAAARVAHRIGPPPNVLSDHFIGSLPFEDYLQWGLESLYSDASSAEAHLCLEQLSCNLRDAILTHATNAEFRFLDESPSLLDSVILTSLYLVRSRVLRVPLLSSVSSKPDSSCSVFAPGLDALNHCGASPAAAAVVSAAQRSVVVRALRHITRGEEITLDYRQTGGGNGERSPRCFQTGSLLGRDEICMDDDCAARYLIDAPR